MTEHNRKGWVWPGNWKVVCDVCGVQFPSSKIKKRWDGLMVCEHDWETRHPQTLYRYHVHTSVPDFIRKEYQAGETLLVCDAYSILPRADFGTAGCAIVGIIYAADVDQFKSSGIPAWAIAGIAIAGKP